MLVSSMVVVVAFVCTVIVAYLLAVCTWIVVRVMSPPDRAQCPRPTSVGNLSSSDVCNTFGLREQDALSPLLFCQ